MSQWRTSFRRSHVEGEGYDIEFDRLTNTGNLYFKVRSKPLHCCYSCYIGLRTGMVHMYNTTFHRLSYRGVPEGIRNFYEYTYSYCGRDVPVVRPGLLKIPESLEVCNG